MSSVNFRLNNCVTSFPQPVGNFERLEFEVFPPDHLIAGVVQLPMIAATERNGELVAKFKTDGTGLRKPRATRIAGVPNAHETRLCGRNLEVRPVAHIRRVRSA